jgi:hypothetical protein
MAWNANANCHFFKVQTGMIEEFESIRKKVEVRKVWMMVEDDFVLACKIRAKKCGF